MSAPALLRLLQASTFTAEAERRQLWSAAFELLRPTMAFAQVSLVLDDRGRRRRGQRQALDAGLAVLHAAAESSRPVALPAEDGGPPLGTHVELDDRAVADTLRDLAPHLLHVQVFADHHRLLLAQRGVGAALPMLDYDDFGEVLTVHIATADLPSLLPVTAHIAPAGAG
jgi:hypothetical protein